MKDGSYIGLHTQVRYWLPYNRKYTELEALISHTLDINDNKSFSISGYSKLWGWSRTKVTNFLQNIKTSGGHHKDIHQDNSRALKGQGVVIKVNNFDIGKDILETSEGHLEDILETSRGHGNDIKNNDLGAKEDKPETSGGHPEDILKTSGEHYYNNKNKNKKKKNKNLFDYSEDFLSFWKEYPRKDAKGTAWDTWQKLGIGNGMVERVVEATKVFSPTQTGVKRNYIPLPATWLNAARWDDELEAKPQDPEWLTND